MLEELCRRHPGHAAALRKRVGKLRELGWLSEPGAASDRIPERLGDFRLLKKLGEGGMGVVYVAEQVSLHRVVALKIIRPERLYFAGARERFLREVEAVARLEHPGIVRVHTVGEEDGIPYYAMERIEGLTLDALLRALAGRRPEELERGDLLRIVAAAAGAPLREDLGPRTGWVQVCFELILQVAEALDHSHRRLVFHRDVKPSNVMLTPEGRAVLVDFGLASTRDASRLTGSGTALGSLPYMPPERLRGSGQASDPRADVYSLGITLHEMLTLQHPFGSKDAATIEQRIRDGDAAPLQEGNRTVPWDAATVCMTAMEHDPARRYPSAAAFAADLRNVLALRPITAQRPGAMLRTRRWMQRHPASTLAAGLLLLFLSIGPPVLIAKNLEISALNVDLKDERDRANHEKKRAVEEAAESRRQRGAADRVIDFLVNLFQASDPQVSFGEEITAKDLLERGRLLIESDANHDAGVAIRLRESTGRAYVALGHAAEARPLLERAWRDSCALRGAEDPQTLRLVSPMVEVFALESRLDGAIQLLRDELPRLERVFGRDSREALEAQARLINLKMATSQEPITATVAALQEMRERARAALGPEDPATLDLAEPLALALATEGDLLRAEAILAEAAAALERHFGPAHPRTLKAMSTHASLWFREGDAKGAEKHLERIVVQLRRVVGDDHLQTLVARNNLAMCYHAQLRFDDATKLEEAVLADAKRRLGPKHLYTIMSAMALGTIYSDANFLDKAVPLLEESLTACKERCGARDPLTLKIQNNFGVLRTRQKKYSEARELLEAAFAGWCAVYGLDHRDTLDALINLATVDEARGADAAAQALYEQVLDVEGGLLVGETPFAFELMERAYSHFLRRRLFVRAERIARELLARTAVGDPREAAREKMLADVRVHTDGGD